MIEFESIVDVQLSAMLEGIESDLARRRQAMLEEADREARRRLRDARRESRQRMAAAVAETREQWYSSLRRARAALAARLRRRQHELDREQLQQGMQQLRAALLARWEEPSARREWAAILLEDGLARFPADRWQVEYPATLAASDAEALLAPPSPDIRLELEAATDLHAGFRLRRGAACLDMSAAGLLAQTEEIAGELLAEIRRQQRPPEGGE